MFGKKSLSTVLFYGNRLITIGYAVFMLLIIIALLTNSYSVFGDNELHIQIPFTDSFIKGKYAIETLIGLLCFFIFYGSFFYILSLIFKTFSAEKLFTEEAIKYLKWFTILNLSLPVIYIIVGVVLDTNIKPEDIIPGLLHVALGIFSAFIATIFRLGFTLQEENELTI